MDRPTIAFTAVYLKQSNGYVGFVEELPGVNSLGRTLEEARENLLRHAEIVFHEERAQTEEMLDGKDVVREEFLVAIPPERSGS
jgi:predicted RNase H-like HicB family nuclease